MGENPLLHIVVGVGEDNLHGTGPILSLQIGADPGQGLLSLRETGLVMVPDDPLQPCLALVPGHGAQMIEPLISLRMGRRLRRGYHGDELRRHQAGVPRLAL